MNERLRRRRLAIVKRRQREREWRRRLLDWRVRPARMIREHLSVDLDDWQEKALEKAGAPAMGIEVTPAMIERGVTLLEQLTDAGSTLEFAVPRVFRAMLSIAGGIPYVDPEDWLRFTSFWGQTRS